MNPNSCPYCGRPNGSNCGHGLGGNQGLTNRNGDRLPQVQAYGSGLSSMLGFAGLRVAALLTAGAFVLTATRRSPQ